MTDKRQYKNIQQDKSQDIKSQSTAFEMNHNLGGILLLVFMLLLYKLIKQYVTHREEHGDEAHQHGFLVFCELQCNLDMIPNPTVKTDGV